MATSTLLINQMSLLIDITAVLHKDHVSEYACTGVAINI
jgi:hypothetical protein